MFEDGPQRNVAWNYQLNLGSEIEHRIQVMELLFDGAYLSRVVDDEKSWFTQMAVPYCIDHQFFLGANN